MGLLLACFGAGYVEPKESGGSSGKEPRRSLAPVMTRVAFSPLHPRPGQELQSSAQVADSDGEHVEPAYQWELNAQELKGEEESTFGSERVRPGDRVAAWVTPYDGKVWGEPVASQLRIISGSPLPKARVELSPAVALPGDLVRAKVIAEVPRLEDLKLYWKWKVNGKVVEEGPLAEFSTEGLRRGDRLQVEVLMEAGGEQAPPLVSEEIVLQNRPPEILSRPPDRLMAPGRYRYVVKARDPDGDPLSFRLEGKLPPGMRIHPQTGVLEWEFHSPFPEPVQVDIRVSDGRGGEAQQTYEFVVSAGQGS